MSESKITIEVDNQTLSADKGQMLIEVTDAHGIYIPRFCYHNKLSIAANCRMCLVEVEKAPKALPACATPVIEGMKVKTRSKAAVASQKAVMEFLLINHPLDCPICDQGGECELQDLAMTYGQDVSRYQEKKRVVKDKNIGPLIQTDLTRCIHCTRCVRFGEEVAGLREIGATGRGENMQIGTYIEKTVRSEMSANIIDLCPVGALTSKPFRYQARSWELVQKNMIAPHDSVGSNIHVHVKGNQLKRVVPAHNEAINEVWLSDRDRFSYEALYSKERLEKPLIKDNGEWKEVDWETALGVVANSLGTLIDTNQADKIGAIASPSSTTEELYLLQKLIRALGSNNVDSRLMQSDFSDQDIAPVFPYLGQSIAEIENLEAILLVGSNVRKEQPIINHRIRKAVLHGASAMLVNAVDYDFNFPVKAKRIVAPNQLVMELASILKALLNLTDEQIEPTLNQNLVNVVVTKTHEEIAENLCNVNEASVVLGNMATAHPQFSLLRSLTGLIAKYSHSRFAYLSQNANTTGAWLAGAIPHRFAGTEKIPHPGKTITEMFEVGLRAYFLMNLEPELDCYDGRQAQEAMNNADFVVSLTGFQNEAMKQYADVLLPIALFAENSGSYINNAGTQQSFAAAVTPLAEARPAWKVLRVLGNYFQLPGFEYQSSQEVLTELNQLVASTETNNNVWKPMTSIIDNSATAAIEKITETPMNMMDSLCRRAVSLQQTYDVSDGAIHISPALAERNELEHDGKAKVEQGGHSLVATVFVDSRVPDHCILIQSAHVELTMLGPAYGEISLVKS